jgi:hypothetical protein
VDWVVTKPFSINRINEIVSEITQRNGIGISRPTIAATGT